MQKCRVPMIVLILTLAAGTGCVQRKMFITSEPEGATVIVNQTWRGTTPFELTFKHHGTYLIRLEKEGYYPLQAKEPIAAPLYQKPVLDFVSEVGPGNYRDMHKLHYKLEKIEEADPIPDIIARGDNMREHITKVADEREKRDTKRHTRKLPLPTKKKEEEKTEKNVQPPEKMPPSAAGTTPKADLKATEPEIE